MLGTAFGGHASSLKKLTVFLNEKYPTLHSLLDLDIEQVDREWIFFLSGYNIKLHFINKESYGTYKIKTPVANFLRVIRSYLFQLTDTREEWEKDRWDVRILHEKYGITYNKTRSNFFHRFHKYKECIISKRS